MKHNRALDAIPAKALSYATVGVVVALFAVMMWVIPQTHDEWLYNRICPDIPCYMENTGDFGNCVGRPIETLSDAWESMRNHYNNWNPRLSNELRIALELTPAWVRDLLCILAFAGFLWLMLKLTLRRWPSAPAVTALVVLSIFLFPSWSEGMFTPTFLFNYVVSALFSLAALWLIDNDYPRRPLQWLWIAPLMAVTPLFHESFTVAFGAAILTLAIQRRTPKAIICLVIYAAFGLLQLLSPINLMRGHGWSLMLVPAIQFFVYDCVPAWAFLLILPVALLKKGKTEVGRFTVENLCYLIATAAMFLFSCFVFGRTESRAIWPANLLMIILDVKFCLWLWPSLGKKSWTTLCIWLASFSLTVAWLSAVIALQDRLMKEQEEIRSVIENASNQVAYLDLTLDTDIPWYYLRAYSSPSTDGSMLLRFQNFASAYDNPLEKNYMLNVILPTATKGINPEDWPLVPGTAGVRGNYPVYYVGKNLPAPIMEDYAIECANPFDESSDWRPMFVTRMPVTLLKSFFNRDMTKVAHIRPLMARHIQENGDTLWFAYFHSLPQGVVGRQIIKIDKSESCAENH